MQRHWSHRTGLVGALFGAVLLCALPAQGQVIEEGYPTKPVFPEEPPAAPHLHEECGPFLDSDAFAEECTGGSGPDAVGIGSDGEGFSGSFLDPAFHTPPRLECPAAVFLEELETSAIHCYASDAAGTEHLDYRWEPIGGATRDYLENPRLIPEDAPNPMVVAPSSPQYEALESFLSEEGTQRYRYRLTATSRATGLSSRAEVEVFVLSSRPEVYCPLEVAVEEGATVVLACEGADPLSFRMDDEAGDAPVLWEWEGLWGASTAPLTAADTPQPLFTAPPGSAGATYHYVASMTTRSSGVARTARRRVSVAVKAAEGDSAPSITCPDSPYTVYERHGDLTLACEAQDAPEGATYLWKGAYPELLTDIDTLVTTFSVPPEIQDYPLQYYIGGTFVYDVTMSDSLGVAADVANVEVTVLERPNIRMCLISSSRAIDEGSAPIILNDCTSEPTGAPGDTLDTPYPYRYQWSTRSSTPSSALSLLSATDVYHPVFTPPADVSRQTVYNYVLTVSADNADDFVFPQDITINDLNAGTFSLECARTRFTTYDNVPDITLACDAPAAPPDAVWLWTHREPTQDTDRLSATDIRNPVFDVQEIYDLGAKEKWFYYNVSVSAGSQSQDQDIVVKVSSRYIITIACADQAIFLEGDNDRTIGNCRFFRGASDVDPNRYRPTWLGVSTTDTRFATIDDFVAATLSDTTSHAPTFYVPDMVDRHEQYVYTLRLDWTCYPRRCVSARPFNVQVLDRESFDAELALDCKDVEVYETGATQDITLSCIAKNVPSGRTPEYEWDSNDNLDLAQLIRGRKTSSPTFRAPAEVDEDKTYVYKATVKAKNTLSGSDIVTVTVLNKPDIDVTCTGNPYLSYEGSGNITLDCSASGAPGPAPDYTYAWTARGYTLDTDRLSATNVASPTFDVPDQVSANETYEYTLTVSAANAEDARADVTVTVLDKPQIEVTCTNPDPVYEGSPDITLDCSQPTGAPAGSAYDYAWTARGNTPNTALLTANADGPRPTFAVPHNIDADAKYEYTLTVSAENADAAMEEVTVTVLNKPAIAVTCMDPDPVYEGSVDRIQLDCSQPTGAPGPPPDYAYAWSARSPTPDTHLLTGTDGPTPVFAVPEDVSQSTKYEYTLMVSADNAETGTDDVTVTVLNEGAISLACDDPDPVYEGAPDFALTCSATGAPGDNPAYSYAWTAQGTTSDMGLLSATDVASPMFMTPNTVDSDETYEYAVTVSAPSAESATNNVTVTVLNKPAIVAACAGNPYSAYEGSEDIALNCLATGASGDNPSYSYAWSPRGSTPDTGLLSAADVASPTFATPAEVSQTTTYEYLLTVMAANAETATVDVTVTVLNAGALALACANPDPVYEGSGDIRLDCAASGAPEGSSYSYVWSARGATTDTGRLVAGADGPAPTFQTPDRVDRDETYEYRLTVSAENAEDATADVTIRVLNNLPLALVCANPDPVYEGSADLRLDCSASGAPAGSDYEYAWSARGSTADTGLLSATDLASPTFSVPADVPQTTRYEYLLTVTAAGADAATSEVTVTVLNTGAIALVCRGNPYSAYEGSGDLALDCSASGAPEGSAYEYVWTARGATADTDLLSAVDGPAPVFSVPDNVSMDERYEYLLTVTAEAAEAATAEVTVTVLDKGALALSCANPDPVYEGSPDFALHCSASGAPDGSDYEYAWTPRGATTDTDLLSAADMASPVFAVPGNVDQNETYEYLLTVSAEHAESATAEVTVTVLNKGALALVCPDNPYAMYEGSGDITLNCSASGAPDGSSYEYAWTPRGSTADTDLLSAADVASPVFAVPDDLPQTTRYEYLLTVSAERAEAAAAEITVTVLDKGALALVCPGNPYSAYEGSEDITLNCAASGAPEGSDYEYAWMPRGATADTDLLSATDVASPTFAVPDSVGADETYEYLLAVSASNAEAAGAEVTVTVLERIEEAPAPDPVALSVDPSALGMRVGVSGLRFGAQSSDTQVSLDPLTDRISTSVSGPHHAGRLTLSADSDLSLDEQGDAALSIELVTPVTLRREGSGDAPLLALRPTWSMAESCEQRASQSIGGLHTNVTLSESDCRLFLFGGELDLTDAPPGRYSGNLNVILRTASGEETHSIEAGVEVISGDRVILAGASGVRFGSSREIPMGLLEEQTVSIYPNLAYLTRERPSGVFELSNLSLIPLEVSVSARFGYTEATEDGRDVVVEDRDSARLGDLSEALEIHPKTLILKPGEQGVVRYGVREEALAEMRGGYAAFFEIASFPRQYARTDWLPEAVSGGKTALVTMRVPGAYAPSEDAPHIRAELLSAVAGDSPSATFLIETGGVPFAGEAVAYDADGRELGRRRTLVYTRSRVRIPFGRLPEGEAVLLRFVPSGSGQASEPVSMPWTAPPRGEEDIGAAMPLKK